MESLPCTPSFIHSCYVPITCQLYYVHVTRT